MIDNCLELKEDTILIVGGVGGEMEIRANIDFLPVFKETMPKIPGKAFYLDNQILGADEGIRTESQLIIDAIHTDVSNQNRRTKEWENSTHNGAIKICLKVDLVDSWQRRHL